MPEEFIIICDSREQNPFSFSSIIPLPKIEYKGLKCGDYSIKNHENNIALERKSLEDLYSSFGHGRVRLRKEFEKLAKLQFPALIIEADFKTIIRKPPERSSMNPKSIFRSILAWSVRWRIPVFPCPNRHFAERTTYLLLKFYWDQYQEKMKDI